MNDQPSPIHKVDDDTPPSPKRKKVRAKYAPKACVSCRRSKLKCSGENPCQRCLDSGKRCFYSEDQTAAEALQNLSRPTPVQPPLPALGSSSNGSASQSGNGMVRRSILPRHDVIERRASDASVLGLSMEARMARIEGMMESLIHDRSVAFTPRGSMERDEAMSVSESLYHAPLEPFNPQLASQRPSLSFPRDSPERIRHSMSATSPSSSADSVATIRVGPRSLAFPSPVDYAKYIDFYFADINPTHPCINEADFRARSERVLGARSIHPTDVCFLALNYIVFAVSDILVDATPPGVNSRPPGWQWFQLADELVGKRQLSGRSDLSLIQFLIWEAFYFSAADRPNAAYNVIGTACRLCFQFGLHLQSSWINCTPFQVHMRQRIFWTLFFTDRRISLSCGRPYGIRDVDIHVDQPSFIYDRVGTQHHAPAQLVLTSQDLVPDQTLPEQDVFRSANTFLACMIFWARLVGDIWDRVFAVSATKKGLENDVPVVLDARIKHWTEFVLPSIPLLPPDHAPELRHRRQHTLVHTRLNHLCLLVRRPQLLSLAYDATTARYCGDLALDTVQRIRPHSADARLPNSFRHCMAAALASALLPLCALLVRDLAPIGLAEQHPFYAEAWRDAMAVLHELAHSLPLARRVLDDYKDVAAVVGSAVQQVQMGGSVVGAVPQGVEDLFPYKCLDFGMQGRVGGTGGEESWGQQQQQQWSEGQGAEGWDAEILARETGWGVLWV
ncbi:hypothetical protein BS50DRAFT_671616 [Corynespora cassiicola Philippines]|uniref:Zn(2)-C6 fungal-type domain-containing protein n=1 Tax=Corynespora cassiicola Philippines TaxID=1448308 RepID=A0A2T2PCW8_CORCC|nr:hypothetical protein BS50DRAFT_671616 [Corynespora cassiicola Philippines]